MKKEFLCRICISNFILIFPKNTIQIWSFKWNHSIIHKLKLIALNALMWKHCLNFLLEGFHSSVFIALDLKMTLNDTRSFDSVGRISGTHVSLETITAPDFRQFRCLPLGALADHELEVLKSGDLRALIESWAVPLR